MKDDPTKCSACGGEKDSEGWCANYCLDDQAQSGLNGREAARYYGAKCQRLPTSNLSTYKPAIAAAYGCASWAAMTSREKVEAREAFKAGKVAERKLHRGD